MSGTPLTVNQNSPAGERLLEAAGAISAHGERRGSIKGLLPATVWESLTSGSPAGTTAGQAARELRSFWREQKRHGTNASDQQQDKAGRLGHR